MKFIVRLVLSFYCMLCAQGVFGADGSQLMNIEVQPAGINKTQIVLTFSGSVASPKSFSVEDPATVVFDFPAAKNKLSRALSNQVLSDSTLKKINVIETDAKTRLVVDLKQPVPFDVVAQGNVIKITFDDNIMQKTVSNSRKRRSFGSIGSAYQIKTFDFRRGEHGEARIVVDLSSDKPTVDFKEEGGKIIVDFIDVDVPNNLVKRYDVTDFATPVQSVVISKDGSNTEMVIEATGDYDKIAYQLDNKFIVEIRNITKAEKAAFNELTGKYTGDKMSLNFQDIEVRAVLQIIADFSKFNIITSDSVKGNITLRLQNVPWDQALDIILKSEGLDKRQYGNVMLVGPAAEIAAREKVELDSQKQMEDLGSMKSELVQINYANAKDLAALLKDKNNSLMTARGTVTVDERTNTLLIQDIPSRLNDIKSLLKKLDVAVRQVEISTQIVTADNTLEDVLGMRFGGGANLGIGHRRLGIGGNVDRARAIGEFTNGAGQSGVPPAAPLVTQANVGSSPNTQGPTQSNSEGLFSDLGAISGGYSAVTGIGGPAKVGLALAKLPNGTLLDLELQALEYESKSKTLAKPKLMTLDKSKATVEKGVEIPYLEASSSGATSVSYKSAVLKLDVTPQITPDDKISLDLKISNDTQGVAVAAGPVVNTNRLETKVLVDNGETVVLGGVLQVTDNSQIAKVPFFGDLPIIGGLFRNKYVKYNPTELVIFLTPRIINPLLKDFPKGSATTSTEKSDRGRDRDRDTYKCFEPTPPC